jgi:GAF domain-containing protein
VGEDPQVRFNQEYAALCGRIQDQRQQADRLRELADRIEEQTAGDEALLLEMEEILGLAPQMRFEALDRRLGGRRLREIAVEVLERQPDSGREIHYRDWYALLEAAGYQVAGRDPLATFLAAVRRIERVQAIGHRSGRYQLITN